MPELNNYVRDQTVNHILIIHILTDQLRTLNAAMANPATSYNSDRTHLTPMSFNAVAKPISSSPIVTTVICHTHTPIMDIVITMNSRPTAAQIVT